MFYRKKEYREPNFDIYLDEWILYIFKNKIIFINIVGNILLFIPLGFFKGIIKSTLIIIIIEILQYILKRGIFDVVDIILNLIGVVIGKIGREIYERRYEHRGIDWKNSGN